MTLRKKALAIWDRWLALLSRKETGTSIALFRIGVATALLGSLITTWRSDLVTALWTDVADGGAFTITPRNYLALALGGPHPHTIWLLFSIGLLAGACVLLGLGGRVSAFVALQAYQALYTSNGAASSSFDVLICNGLWLCVLGDTSRTLSLDAWRRHRSFVSSELVSAWPRYLAVFQILLVYTSTGLQKLSPGWLPSGGYSAIYWTLQDPNWRRFDGIWAARLYPLTQVATLVTWLFEVSAPLMMLHLYLRSARPRKGRLGRALTRFDLRIPYLAVGIALHVGIEVAMNVGVFSIVAMSFYPAFFAPKELESLFGRGVKVFARASIS